MRTKFLVLVGILVMALAVTPAMADITDYTLSTGNAAVSGYPGPYVYLTVDRTSSTTATLTFYSQLVNGNIYLMGDGGSADVNVNASSWTIGSFVYTNAGTGFTPGAVSDGGSGTVDGFGTFNQTTTSFDGFTHSSDYIQFVLTNTGGAWGSATDVLTNNADGYLAGAHIFITSYPADADNGAIATGYVVNGGGGGGVPIPPSAWLLGSGLIGLAGLGWRRRKC
jgi:hypothetical protein